MISKELLAQVRKIEIKTRRIVDDITAGAYHSVFKGRGIEFDEVREYTPEDDVRDIDWNVTARMGAPYIKKYVEERELTVMLAVDASASGAFGSGEKSKRQLAVETAALIAFSAIRNNDRVGLLIFTDQIELYVPPRSGKSHGLRLVRELMAMAPRGTGTDIAGALERLMKVLKKRAVVFLLSDLMDDGFARELTIVGKRHDVVAVRTLDPLEIAMPRAGNLVIEDAESGERLFWKGRWNRLFGKSAQKAVLAGSDVCRLAKVDLIELRCGEDIVRPFVDFFKNRRR